MVRGVLYRSKLDRSNQPSASTLEGNSQVTYSRLRYVATPRLGQSVMHRQLDCTTRRYRLRLRLATFLSSPLWTSRREPCKLGALHQRSERMFGTSATR